MTSDAPVIEYLFSRSLMNATPHESLSAESQSVAAELNLECSYSINTLQLRQPLLSEFSSDS